MNKLAKRYLNLLKKSLINELHVELESQLIYAVLCASHQEVPELETLTAARGNATLITHLNELKDDGDTLVLKGLNDQGRSVPLASLRNHSEFAHTLIGRTRLNHLQQCVETVVSENVPGDLLEAGCWRGGAAILMKGVLSALECSDRRLWVADSFAGLPKPALAQDRDYEMDADTFPVLSVSLEKVKALFDRYELLDDGVQFIAGWFGDSLRAKPAGPLALLHIDADLYESTRDVLNHCHDRVAPGGFVIVDDYGILPPCREAVDDFLAIKGLDVEVILVGRHAAYWRIP